MVKHKNIWIIGTLLAMSLLTACGNTESTDAYMPTSEVTAQEASILADSESETPQEPEAEPTETEADRSGGDEAMVSDEEQIIAVYERMQQAMVDKDTDTLREMMGADTIVRHITGRTQTMDEWLSDVENEEMKYYSIEVTDPEIVIDGDTATLTCSNVIDARIYGSRGTWTLSGGAAFEKINGEWVMAHPEND